jgi:ubiquinone/menaquinone biosynthesis C-methylase UbiE
MKLTDATHGLKGTALEAVTLEGETLEAHRAFWDHSAGIDSLTAILTDGDERSFEDSGRTEAEAMRRFAGPGARVLDIGCGTGRIMRHAASWCRVIHGVDISAEMVRQGREQLADLPNVHLHVGNGYDLGGFESGSFDLVYSVVALQHMPRTVAFNYLCEAHRVLTQGGTMWFYVPNLLREQDFAGFNHLSQPWFVTHPYPMNFYTPQEIGRLAVAAGFRLEHLTDEMRIQARKTAEPGLSEQAQQAIGLHDAARRRLEEHNAQLERRLAELERQLARIRSHPLVRLAVAGRRRLRRLARR